MERTLKSEHLLATMLVLGLGYIGGGYKKKFGYRRQRLVGAAGHSSVGEAVGKYDREGSRPNNTTHHIILKNRRRTREII